VKSLLSIKRKVYFSHENAFEKKPVKPAALPAQMQLGFLPSSAGRAFKIGNKKTKK
jgi:hypothetical protein